MDGLIFVLLIILLLLVNRLTNKVNLIGDKVDILIRKSKQSQAIPSEEQQKPKTKNTDKKRPINQQDFLKQSLQLKSYTEEDLRDTEQAKPTKKPSPEPVFNAINTTKLAAAPKKESKRRPTFMERNPDLEKFIGENLLSKVGIVIFVIGMGFLVKLGIDNDVITESMRVAIGLVIGGGVIGLAHYLRKSFIKFSSILIGGALAVLYFTIALAFHEYNLISQTPAFIIMVAITAFGVLLSIAYDRIELAVLATIGGFGTPFFLSNGSGNINVLFSYIIILDIGMLLLVYFKKWNIINYITYSLSYLLYVWVYFNVYLNNQVEHRISMFIALSAFYFIFFMMSVIYNVKNKLKFKPIEITSLLSNSAIYFGFGLALSNTYKNGIYNGLFTTLVAVFNFTFSLILFKRKNIDKNLLYLLIGLVLTFVSLIGPIQLEGNNITLFWAVESVLLLWLANKSGIKVMKFSALLVAILMIVSLVIDWQQNYFPKEGYIVLNPFLNKAFITSIIALAAMAGVSILTKQNQVVQLNKFSFHWKNSYAKVLFVIILFFTFYIELNYQFIHYELVNSLRQILLGIYIFTFVTGLMVFDRLNRNITLGYTVGVISCLLILSYCSNYLRIITTARDTLLENSNLSTGFYWHYLLLSLFLIILVNLVIRLKQLFSFQSREGKISLWVLSFIGVFICSTEAGHVSIIYQSSNELSVAQAYQVALKSVYPIIWGLSAFVLMIVGMKFKLKSLRIASLVLFLITIIKLFLYDLADNTTGKVVSFIFLGVILLLISFLYQKLKFIILDDEDHKNSH